MHVNLLHVTVQMSSHIKGIGFDKSYSPVANSDSLRINIAIMAMHRLTARILDVSNSFQNKNVPIHEIVCVIEPPYYLYCFEISYPNVPLNRDDAPFFLQCMNGIQGTEPAGQQRNILLDAVVTIIKYRKIIIDHAIYIKFFTDGKVSHLKKSTDDVLDTNNNET